RKSDQVQYSWGCVDQAGRAPDPDLFSNQIRRRDEIGHVYVFVVNRERVAEISRVLPEGLAVISEDHEQYTLVQIPLPQPAEQVAESRISIMQSISVAPKLAVLGEG